ncbi:MAG: hypothetical protein U0414_41730 [Polyangiaceae bacterium]
MSTFAASRTTRTSIGAWVLLGAWVAGCAFEVPAPYDSPSSGGAAASSAGGAPSSSTDASVGSTSSSASTTSSTSASTSVSSSSAGSTSSGATTSSTGSGCGPCDPGEECFNGQCGCPQGTNACTNPPGCYATDGDRDHCGGACIACPAGQICSSGQCMCPVGEQTCPGFSGCFDLSNDEAHCGSCTKACKSFEVCQAMACVCAAGEKYCPASSGTAEGCFADTQTNPGRCGPSCAVCTNGQTCVNGACGCPTGTTDCGGVCVADLMTDAAHCGSCARSCGSARFPGATCAAGRCSPAPATNVPALVGTLVLDPLTPHRIYAATASPPKLVRFSANDAAAVEVGPDVDVINLIVGARGEEVAWTWDGATTPLLHGAFSQPLTQGVSIAGGATFFEHVGPTLYWSENDETGGCVLRDPTSPIAFACSSGHSARSFATASNHAYVLTTNAPWIQRFTLPGSARTDVDIAGPAVTAAHASPSIAVDPSDTYVFYFIVSPSTELHRTKVTGSAITDDIVFASLGSSAPLAVFTSGTEVVWASASFASNVVTISRAPILSPAQAATVSTFTVPSATDTRSWAMDGDAIYFVAQNFSGGFTSTAYRVSR